MKHRLTILAVAMSLMLVACDQANDTTEKLQIVVTTNILGDVVSNIVGENASVEVLMPIGADSHDFQASSAQVARINAADLVIVNGLGLEEGLVGVLATAVGDGVRVLEIAPLLEPIRFDGPGHDHHDDDDDQGYDPHVWMDPVRMADAARLIAAELALVAPGIDWAGRAEAYATELMSAHGEIESILDAVPPSDRQMVTNHDVFGYFADRYGWEVVGTVIPGGTTLGSPSAADLADLIEAIRHEGVKAIFVETSSPDAIARVVAEEVGAQVEVVTLHTESLGEPGSEAGTLIGMLLDNARRIAGAMTGSG